jgi:hypothetical protein
LNGAFLVDAEYRCIDRWLEIQTDDIGSFFLELWIVTGKIAAQAMRLQPGFGQDARYPECPTPCPEPMLAIMRSA